MGAHNLAPLDAQAVEASAFLVVRLDDIPRCLFDVRMSEHLVLGF